MSTATSFIRREHSATELTRHYLEDHGVAYKLFEHDERFSAAAEAEAAGVVADHAAKEILIRDQAGYRLAVIPASERLDLAKLRDLFEAEKQPTLATEDEMEADFPTFEIGALPPLGSLLGVPLVIDSRIFDHSRVLCNAGDHRHSMLIDPRDIADLADVRIGNICEE